MNSEDLTRFENAKIEVYEEGRSKILKKAYFTKAGVELGVKHQGKSQSWHRGYQDCARAVREVKESMAMRSSIMVNKVEVQRMETSDELEPGKFKIRQSGDGGNPPSWCIHR